ncbi:MAG: polymer-forming cytoskeletal protein [Thermoanaerobaculia bacterium]
MRNLALGCAVVLGSAGFAQAVEAPPALVIEEGSLARDQVVALGRDLRVDGEARSGVAAVNGTVRIRGRVGGDVTVLGGDALLSSTARVSGDVFVLGGRIEASRGARIEGRSVAYPSVGSAWLTLLEGPSLGLSQLSPVVVGAKLALLAAWMGLALILMATSGREVLSTSESIAREPFRNFFVGLTGVMAIVLTGLFFTSFAPAVAGIPMLTLVVLLALLLKLWGMVAVFHALGSWTGSHLFKRRTLPANGTVLGLLILGGFKLLPWVGTWVWTVATLIAVGASLTTKFGRREPWFEVGSQPLDSAAS